ncbi:transcriptional regulator [Vibrio sp. CDRSL-10 TSBA]
MSNTATKFILADRFTFDPTSNSLVDKEADNENVRLGSNESRILLLLSQRPNEVITRNELHDFVWREQGFEVDDSSLTQAVSTLRKMLKDSTKSPQFVKTVPKRGYQLIAEVEQLEADETAQAPDEQPEQTERSGRDVMPADIQVAATSAPAHTTSATTDKAAHSPLTLLHKSDLRVKIMLIVAILLPLCVILFTSPAPSKLRQLADYNGVTVSAPVNQPDLSAWMPLIESCIIKYVKLHPGEMAPKEVIATGGHNNQLVLNYIHAPQFSGQNITLRILSTEEDIDQICQ